MSFEAVYGVMALALLAYTLTGGADFGGGIWDLLARGPRAAAQRAAIAQAIAPIWEANHIWVIFLVVLTFSAFPDAFAAISIGLHLPLLLALLGIVLRGSAFIFRAYGLESPAAQARWGRVFGLSSLLTPVFLGLTLAALATGQLRWDGHTVTTGFFAGWLSPFALFTGLFATALFALLAAVYLAVETDGPLRRDFLRRAVAADAVALVGAVAALVAARRDAPEFVAALFGQPAGWLALALGLAAGVAALAALLVGRDRLARVGVVLQVSAVVLGFGVGMDGHLVRPDLHLHDAGGRLDLLAPMLPALVLGAAALGPSLWVLYRVFKGRTPAR